MVEFAILLPVLSVLFLGVLEFGNMYRQRENIQNALRQSLRVMTNEGNGRWAEADGLLALKAGLVNSRRISVTRITVWVATAVNSTVPSSCSATNVTTPSTVTGAGVVNVCNVYGNASFNAISTSNLSSYFDAAAASACSTSGTILDRYWCPKNRNDQQRFASYVGLQVRFSYTSLTSLLASTVTMTDQLIMRIEPG